MNSKRSDTGVGSGLRAGKLWKLPRYGNLWKNKKHFPTGSHSAWKTLREKTSGEFPTVPTASAAIYLSKKKRFCERSVTPQCICSQDPVLELTREPEGLAAR